MEYILQEILNFLKNILNFSIFMMPYKSREIPGEFYCLVEILSKKFEK